MKTVVRSVSAAAADLEADAQSMTRMSEESTERAITGAAATVQASSNVATVAHASEGLAASIEEISRQVTESSLITREATGDLGRINDIVQTLVEAADQIGGIIQLINDIARQTNLLALNASIEAARAGEAGRGFAVVAHEVKSLANQTAGATSEIFDQVKGMQKITEDIVRAMAQISQAITRIDDISTLVASAVGRQAAATSDISHNARQAAVGTHEVSQTIDSVSKAANQTGGAAARVLEAARQLSTEAEALTTQVDQFIGQVRAA